MCRCCLDRCRCVGDGGLASLAEAPLLCELTLTDSLRVTDAGVVALSRARKGQLERVDLTGCAKLTDEGVRALLRNILQVRCSYIAASLFSLRHVPPLPCALLGVLLLGVVAC